MKKSLFLVATMVFALASVFYVGNTSNSATEMRAQQVSEVSLDRFTESHETAEKTIKDVSDTFELKYN